MRRFLPEVLDMLAAANSDPLAISKVAVDWDDDVDAWLEPAAKLLVRL